MGLESKVAALQQAPAPTRFKKRNLKQQDFSTYTGLTINKDKALITMGVEQDVVMMRNGPALLRIDADLDITGRTIALSDEVSISADSQTKIVQDMENLKIMSASLSHHSIVLIKEFADKFETNKWAGYAHLDGAQHFENTDISAMAKNDAELKDSVYLMMTVHLTANSHWPTTFEMTNANNKDGFMVTLPAPTGGWQVGDNYIKVSTSKFKYPGTPNWKDQHRLELYLSGGDLKIDETITLKNVRLVDADMALSMW